MESSAASPQSSGRVVSATFCPRNLRLATADHGGWGRIWDLDTKKMEMEFPVSDNSWAISVTFSHDAQKIAIGDSDGYVFLWNIKNVKKLFYSGKMLAASLALGERV